MIDELAPGEGSRGALIERIEEQLDPFGDAPQVTRPAVDVALAGRRPFRLVSHENIRLGIRHTDLGEPGAHGVADDVRRPLDSGRLAEAHEELA
ncbi:MAG: hypothetical protein ACRES6_02175 [Steroidobacteraceae bacterium]